MGKKESKRMKFTEEEDEIQPDVIKLPELSIPTPDSNFLEESHFPDDEGHYRLSRKQSEDRYSGFSMGTFMLTIVACVCLFSGYSYIAASGSQTPSQSPHLPNPTPKYRLFTTFTSHHDSASQHGSSFSSFLYLLPIICVLIFTLGYGI